MRQRRRPVFLLPQAANRFPDPREFDAQGLVAVGGDLSVERLLGAYDQGIFPWYEQGLPPMWWSPDPRALMDRDRLHVSRSLRRVLRAGRFTLSLDRAFGEVMRECGREREGGSWIFSDMLDAYQRLFELGHAHSVEVWQGARLVGGLYGVQRGGLFAAESMFHRVTDASKVALVYAVRCCFESGIELFDVQFLTPHLASLGAYEVSRPDYLARVERAAERPVVALGPAALGRVLEARAVER